jgi:hypothetical protein
MTRRCSQRPRELLSLGGGRRSRDPYTPSVVVKGTLAFDVVVLRGVLGQPSQVRAALSRMLTSGCITAEQLAKPPIESGCDSVAR